MTIHWKAVAQYFTVVLFVFQFSPVCYFEKNINFGFGTVRSERIKQQGAPLSSKHIQLIATRRSNVTYNVSSKESLSNGVLSNSIITLLLKSLQMKTFVTKSHFA